MNCKPHYHAAVIKAWADGSPVQVRTSSFGPWEDLTTKTPSWFQSYEYRVKPTNVIRYAPVMQMPAKALVVGNGVISLDCAKKQVSQYDTLVGVLRIELDPDTGHLLSVQMER